MFDLLYNNNIAYVQQVCIDSLEDYRRQLKAKEIHHDECVPEVYGLEQEAKQKGYECRRIKFVITYYYADNTPLQGGYNDKYGKPLHSHNYPICAAPNDIPYGSVLVLDHPVNGSEEYKIVDTGSAIRWIDGSTCRIDIFVPDAKKISDITTKYENKIVEGKIYFKK